MKRYASGYALLNICSSIGSLIIFFSVIGAIAAYNISEETWMAVLVFAVGAFQGLILMGLSAIGVAILDGSTAQQALLEQFKVTPAQRQKVPPANEHKTESRGSVDAKSQTEKTRAEPQMKRPEQAGHEEIYLGKMIRRVSEGYEVVGVPQIFETISEATKWIDKSKKNQRT